MPISHDFVEEDLALARILGKRRVSLTIAGEASGAQESVAKESVIPAALRSKVAGCGSPHTTARLATDSNAICRIMMIIVQCKQRGDEGQLYISAV